VRTHSQILVLLLLAVVVGPLRADDWLGQKGPKIQLMPKSDQLELYSEIMPAVLRDESAKSIRIFNFSWPVTASKESGQWLFLQSDPGAGHKQVKGWIKKSDILKLESSPASYYPKLANEDEKDDALYHWLLGVAWEAQKQNGVARYQYNLAAEHKQASREVRAHAAWGRARLNAALNNRRFSPKTRETFRKEVDDGFGVALTHFEATKIPPSLHVDWGLALEQALPPPPAELPIALSALITGPLTPYPPSIVIPKQESEFEGIREILEHVLEKYKAAQDRPPSNPHSDRSQWDKPHRQIASVYGRYRIKRSFGNARELYIDIDGTKKGKEETVNADDEFIRALRRDGKSQETRNQRATLLFQYFSEANTALNFVRPSGTSTSNREIALRTARVKDLDKLIADYRASVRELQAQVETWESVERANSTLPANEKEAFAAAQRLMKAREKVVTANTDLDALRGKLDAARKKHAYVKIVLERVEESYEQRLPAMRKMFSRLFEQDPDLNRFDDVKQAEVRVMKYWQRAYDEALAAADLGTYRNSESLNMLANVCYHRPDFPSGGNPSLETLGRTRPMLDEAIRFEKLAAEYAREDVRLTYLTAYFLWYNERLGNFVDLQPDNELRNVSTELTQSTAPNSANLAKPHAAYQLSIRNAQQPERGMSLLELEADRAVLIGKFEQPPLVVDNSGFAKQ
jgi:hypothetical protein